jgi:hypothetical protein
MKRLSNEDFAHARNFLLTNARPLEQALFKYRFEGGPDTAVIAALRPFQNPDGGFGHGLEPDVRTPTSSALATGMALNIFKALNTPYANPLVKQAVEYLLRTFDPERRTWRVVPPDANDHPHAPWWHDEDGSLARTFDDFQVIPRTQIVGLLYNYAELVDREWLDRLAEETVSDVESLETRLFGGGGDTLVYALSLVETERVPEHYRERLLPRLREVTTAVVSTDPAEWDSYVVTPLKVAPLPQSPVADLLEEALARHLDYVVDDQVEEGFWQPSWGWGESYPAAWAQAEQEWRGVLTLDHLTSLRAFGRLAP